MLLQPVRSRTVDGKAPANAEGTQARRVADNGVHRLHSAECPLSEPRPVGGESFAVFVLSERTHRVLIWLSGGPPPFSRSVSPAIPLFVHVD